MSFFGICITDLTTFCPACGGTEYSYEEIPEHRRQWETDGEEHVTHMPAIRDYRCENCDHEWSMSEAES